MWEKSWNDRRDLFLSVRDNINPIESNLLSNPKSEKLCQKKSKDQNHLGVLQFTSPTRSRGEDWSLSLGRFICKCSIKSNYDHALSSARSLQQNWLSCRNS
jgi:hypothetical protein